MTDKLSAPAGKHLDCHLEDTVTEAALQRTWRGFEARRDGRSHRRAALVLTVASCAAAIAGWVLWPRGTVPEPLATADGRSVAAALTERPTAEALDLVLSDRSRVSATPNTAVELAENSGDRVHLIVRFGEATFQVDRQARRRWTVDCGPVSVEVTGTEFTVQRTELLGTSVHVASGTVRVSSQFLSPPVQHLSAGQSVTVGETVASTSTEATDPQPSDAEEADHPEPTDADAGAAAERLPANDSETPAVSSRPARAAGRTGSWRRARERGDHQQAFEILGTAGVRRLSKQTDDVDTLLALADVARSSGNPRAAIAPLRRIMRSHANDPRASVSALTLGRILHSSGNPSAAADAFERALALGLPQALVESAHLRVVKAHAQAGSGDCAADWARRYLKRFPNGRHTNSMQERLR